MAEAKYKTEVKTSLDGLVIPDLQNIICQFVQITSLGGHWANWWRENPQHFRTVTIAKGSRVNRNWYNAVKWIGDHTFHGFTTWDGPEISATLTTLEINNSLVGFDPAADVIFTFSDSKNFSFHLHRS